MIESESRPYRIEIEKMMAYEDVSAPMPVEIMPSKVKIRNNLEKRLKIWFDQQGYALGSDLEFEHAVEHKIVELQPLVVQEVGLDLLNNSIPEWYFEQGRLRFRINFSGFRPFFIETPLSETEAFKANFDKISYSDVLVIFNDDDEFVINHIEVYEPSGGRTYTYERAPEEIIKQASFSISFSRADY
ncbi:MAG: hypothetical protein RIE58_11275 [Vicingaceae bacterium]